MCGTEPHPDKFKAKKYKLHEHFITKEDFLQLMTNLPEKVRISWCIYICKCASQLASWLKIEYFKVSWREAEAIFSWGDKDGDGSICFTEFQNMLCTQKEQILETADDIMVNSTQTIETNIDDNAEEENLIDDQWNSRKE